MEKPPYIYIMKQFRNTKYHVTEDGRVWNGKRFLRLAMTQKGYLNIELRIDKQPKKFMVHRLVMEVYCGYSDLTVHHKDEDKTNNHLSNLEYLTARENTHRSKKSGLPEYVTIHRKGGRLYYKYVRKLDGKVRHLKNSKDLNEILEFKKQFESTKTNE